MACRFSIRFSFVGLISIIITYFFVCLSSPVFFFAVPILSLNPHFKYVNRKRCNLRMSVGKRKKLKKILHRDIVRIWSLTNTRIYFTQMSTQFTLLFPKVSCNVASLSNTFCIRLPPLSGCGSGSIDSICILLWVLCT